MSGFTLKWLYAFAPFSVALFSTYAVLTETYLDDVNYIIYSLCCVDMIAHAIDLRPMKWDMVLHHIFVLAIIMFYFQHVDLIHSDADISHKNYFIKHVVSTEISTIFLAANDILKPLPRAAAPARTLSRVAFAGTFLYYRTYNYFVRIVISPDTHLFVFRVARGDLHLMYLYGGVFGLWALNWYWTWVLARKIAGACQTTEKGGV